MQVLSDAHARSLSMVALIADQLTGSSSRKRAATKILHLMFAKDAYANATPEPRDLERAQVIQPEVLH